MKNYNPNPVATAAVLTAWSAPLVVLAAMVCPPALLAIPAAGIVAGERRHSKRKTAAEAAEIEAAEIRANWARWNALPRP